MRQRGQGGQHRFVLHGLLAEHALGDAGVLEKTLVAVGVVLPADPGSDGPEQDQPEDEGAGKRQGFHQRHHALPPRKSTIRTATEAGSEMSIAGIHSVRLRKCAIVS
ncbi:hypothetical protein D9M72_339890 [compost metagenome]